MVQRKGGVVKVRITKDMDQFNLHSGDIVQMTEMQFRKFAEKYECVEKIESGSVMIRILPNGNYKELMRKFGSGYYPNSEHLVDRNLLGSFPEGSYELIGQQDEPQRPAPKPETSYTQWVEWFKSHPDWNGLKYPVAVTAISLAFQTSEQKSREILAEWSNYGINVENDIVKWKGD